MTERGFWKRAGAGLRDAARAARLDFLIQRVENYAGRSNPDVYFATSTAAGWIELKVCRPDRASVTFQPGQVAWIERARSLGIRCWVLVGTDPNPQVDGRGAYLFDGAERLARVGLSAYDAHFREPVDWSLVLAVLERGEP